VNVGFFFFFINILQADFAPIFFCQRKELQSQIVIREKLHKALLYEKVASKMLMKLTPGHFAAQYHLHIRLQKRSGI